MTPDCAEFKAIDELTRQTNYTALCECALGWLGKLAPGLEAELYEAYDVRGFLPWETTEFEHLTVRQFPEAGKVARPPWLDLAFSKAKKPRSIEILEWTGAGQTVYICCLGSTAGLWRFVNIVADQELSVLIEPFACIIHIFANQIALLDRFERDPLTGLLNRQSFDYRFEEIIEHHRQNPNREVKSNLPWLAFVDIDHFKSINDDYGHLFGDEILLLFAQLMQKTLRFDDLLVRYGGEEFVIILHNTDAAGAGQALERFREAVEEYDFATVGNVTASIGWVAITPDDIAVNVIHKADKALYHAKESGRNRVVSYERTFEKAGQQITETLIDIG